MSVRLSVENFPTLILLHTQTRTHPALSLDFISAFLFLKLEVSSSSGDLLEALMKNMT